MHQLHFPLQSGFDLHPARDAPLLPGSAKFLDIGPHPRRHARRADFTDIVGSWAKLEETSSRPWTWCRARFSSAFTFVSDYHTPLGTPAAAMEQIPRDVVQDRFDRLVALQEQIIEENLAIRGRRDVEDITGKLGKKDTDTHRVTACAENRRAGAHWRARRRTGT